MEVKDIASGMDNCEGKSELSFSWFTPSFETQFVQIAKMTLL